MSFNNRYKLYSLLAFCALIFTFGCAKDHEAAADPTANRPDTVLRFSNPIKESVNNPYLFKKDGFYYFLKSGGNFITISKITRVEYLGSASATTVYSYDPKDGSGNPLYNITSPELHFFDGKWYLYFSADKDGTPGQKRMYVLENAAVNPLEGSWKLRGKIADAANDFMATDATVLEYNNQRYLIWSGWPTLTVGTNSKQNLYIAKMSDPATISGGRVLLSEANADYEKYQFTLNSVPQIQYIDQNPETIKNAAGRVFLTFTAGSCASDNVGLGLLSLKTGGDPIAPADWTKSSALVFGSNGTDSYGPAFNGFFKSNNGTEDWIIYDTNKFPNSGCGSSRNAVIQKITWKADGTPDFGTAVSPTLKLTRPAH